MAYLLTLGGIIILMLAGDALVRGAIGLSLKLGLSATLISLTVVAFGTSAPELVISIEAALKGATDIALGNVVGSNIANSWLIIGLPALMIPMVTNDPELRRSFSLMILATLVFTLMALTGVIGRPFGFILLALLVAITVFSYMKAKPGEIDEEVEAEKNTAGWKIAALVLAGMIALPIGAHMLIEGARGIATQFGLSEAAIGLTVVALGTSLPELAASTAAAWRGRGDVAIANVLGSNMLNLLAVLGVTAAIHPLEISRSFLTVDIPVMILASLMLAPFLIWNVRLGRRAGILFLALYAAFAVLALGDASV